MIKMGVIERISGLFRRKGLPLPPYIPERPTEATSQPNTQAKPMEVKHKVEVFEIDYKCPECEKGWLRPQGQTDGINYPHACNNAACSYKQSFKSTVYTYRTTQRVVVD